MGKLFLVLSGMVCLCLRPTFFFAQSSEPVYPYEQLIEDYISPYQLSPDNQFRLAMYAELRGRYSSEYQSLTMNFGSLATLTFYNENCLLRTANNRIYHLDRRRVSERSVGIMDQALTEIFDRILLLGNHEADPELVEFIDEALSKKNIEPFQKMYLRHVLIRYGYFDKPFKRVIFHTDWLPDQSYSYRGPTDISIVDRPIEPLKVKLDDQVIRGYYLNSGGTVYVEDVDRDVSYASGEEYGYNIHAFKLFAQRLFTQTTQYIVGTEQNRLDEMEARMATVVRDVMAPATSLSEPEPTPLLAHESHGPYQDMQTTRGLSSDASFGRSRGMDQPSTRKTEQTVKPKLARYSQYDWISLMLAQLRSRGINIGDPDIIQYFVDHPDFQHLYKLLTPKEKAKVDRNRKW
ncbi:MAG: hypothetical protein AAF587_26660 [Bacteroidota bacterium]